MNCQKCRAPLKLDQSLENLNPAAFDLLTGNDGEGASLPSHLPYPKERLETYERAAQDAGSPLNKRSLPVPRRGIAAPAAAGPAGPAAMKDSTMSFVLLSESQVEPRTATPAATTTNPLTAAQASPSKAAATAALSPGRRPASAADDPRRPLAARREAHERLFALLSARSDIDHPICAECAELALAGLQTRLQAAGRERDAYVAFLRELRSNAPMADEVAAAETARDAAQAAERRAFAELRALETEQEALEAELAGLDAEARALDGAEADAWRARNALDARIEKQRDARDALAAAAAHDAAQLRRLQRTNAHNDAFCVSHDGHFATINGLRLGRRAPSGGAAGGGGGSGGGSGARAEVVDWAEINAAWGATALLLAVVAERLGCSFRGYVLRPMGSTSRIERLDYPTSNAAAGSGSSLPTSTRAGGSGRTSSTVQQQEARDAEVTPRAPQPRVTPLELFSSGDLPLGRQLLHRRFNEAMVAFLDCLQQLGEHVERGGGGGGASDARGLRDDRRDSPGSGGGSSGGGSAEPRSLRLPYAIERDRIGGLSIRLGAGSDDEWSTACKYALTCCKFLLAHASNLANEGRAPR